MKGLFRAGLQNARTQTFAGMSAFSVDSSRSQRAGERLDRVPDSTRLRGQRPRHPARDQAAAPGPFRRWMNFERSRSAFASASRVRRVFPPLGWFWARIGTAPERDLSGAPVPP